MNYFYIYRNVVFGLCLIFNFPVLGLTAVWAQDESSASSFEGMGLFTTCVSLLVYPVLLILPAFRKNAIILYVFSEIIIVFVMWILWMTSMILVIEQGEFSCIAGNFQVNDQLCQDLFAIQGLTVFIFVILLKYLLYLTIIALINHSRGVYVWKKSVKGLQVKMPKLTHSSSNVGLDSKPAKADASLFGAPSAYPPPQQVSYAQPQTMFPSGSYSNTSMQYTDASPSMHTPTQVNQSVSHSQRPPPVTQNYAHSAMRTPAVAQV